ncbi:MAG TPA: xanthine dehydrogenase family protein molybdopterin-binding subunit [Acidiphilium sp.]
MSIGTARPRIEGTAKVTGAARYAADNYPDDMLFATTVGASVAHGRVAAIDLAAAMNAPGVVRVLTAGDMPALGKIAPPAAVLELPMQGDRIEWEGQPVALVLAETIEAAEEGASLVRVSIETRPAMVPGKGRLETPPDHFAKARETKGDVETGFHEADFSITNCYFQPSRHHNPMETSATVASWQGDHLTLWNAAQANLNAPVVLAAAFGIPKENIRSISPHTGGGFGCKGFVWPHELLAAAAAKIMNRPVRLQLTRAQQYSQVGHQPECRQTMTLGAKADGTLTAIRHEAINTTSASGLHFEAPGMASRGYYACENIEIEHQVEHIHTTQPTPMRAPVEGPGSWALESAMDEMAIALGIDPLDFRLKNYAETEPVDGKPWSSKKLREAYIEAAGVYGWRTRAERPRQDGVYAIGHGMGTAGMFCARFPGAARVRIQRDGGVIIEASANDIGTGNQTVYTLVAADTLGISPDRIGVRWGDTRYVATGPVYGSSHTMGTGSAVRVAVQEARRKLQLYGAKADGPLDLAELMRRANVEEIVGDGAWAMPDGAPASMNGNGTPYAMQTFGVTMVEIGVDRDLGVIRLRRAVARYSAGRIINPLTARSQMIGGIIWEWGKATMEASPIEPGHGRFLAKNLSNVAVPVNADIPSAIDVGFVDEFDEHASPIGARGIGELGSTGVAAAIANAVYDAVGIRVREVPILPAHIIDGLG